MAKNLILEKCTLDPHCRPELKHPERKMELCTDCTHCGWNLDEIERRKEEKPCWRTSKK